MVLSLSMSHKLATLNAFRIQVDGANLDMEVAGMPTAANGYVAVGFSKDNEMVSPLAFETHRSRVVSSTRSFRWLTATDFRVFNVEVLNHADRDQRTRSIAAICLLATPLSLPVREQRWRRLANDIRPYSIIKERESSAGRWRSEWTGSNVGPNSSAEMGKSMHETVSWETNQWICLFILQKPLGNL